MARRSTVTKGISVGQLQRALASGRVDPVYLVSGSDDFLRRKAFEALRDAIAADGAGEAADAGGLAVERLDGGQLSLTEILDTARSLPLFLPVSDRPSRLVWVSRFNPAGADSEALKEYFGAPVEATCLVFEVVKLDGRRAASKLLTKASTRVNCDPPDREADVRRWIESAVEARGYRIEPDAVAFLLEMVGADLQQLDQELEKVSLYVRDRAGIESRDLEQLLGRSREHSVFELTDALVQSDLDRAVTVLNRLVDDGEEPLRILAMVSWIVRQLIIAQDLSASDCPERELFQQLGGRWDQRREILRRARTSSATELEAILVGCSEADVAVKVHRGAPARGALEALCRRVCGA